VRRPRPRISLLRVDGKEKPEERGRRRGGSPLTRDDGWAARCSDEGMGDIEASSRRKPDAALAVARCTCHGTATQRPRETVRRALGASGRENGSRGVEVGEKRAGGWRLREHARRGRQRIGPAVGEDVGELGMHTAKKTTWEVEQESVLSCGAHWPVAGAMRGKSAWHARRRRVGARMRAAGVRWPSATAGPRVVAARCAAGRARDHMPGQRHSGWAMRARGARGTRWDTGWASRQAGQAAADAGWAGGWPRKGEGEVCAGGPRGRGEAARHGPAQAEGLGEELGFSLFLLFFLRTCFSFEFKFKHAS
jgi:hypothetical protein